MSVWRITETNPIRDLGHLDFERCAGLHNEIIERGWTQAGWDLADLPRTTFWDSHRAELEELSDILDSSLLEFYKLAMSNTGTSPDGQQNSFFYMVGCLSFPNFDTQDPDDADEHQFVTMYPGSLRMGAHHPGAVVLDQRTFLAMYHYDILDEIITLSEGTIWYPLEMILQSWLTMMDEGKIAAFSKSPNDQYPEWERPWAISPYSQTDLDCALSEFEALVAAIEARMPEGSIGPRPIKYGFFTSDDDAMDIMPVGGFAREFLNSARKPRFQYIAPGLEFDPSNQPFKHEAPIEPDAIRPILLARGADDAAEDMCIYGGNNQYRDSRLPFRWAIPNTPKFPSGLYLTALFPRGSYPFEDGCRLILPYQMGANGWARRSDNSFIGQRDLRGPPKPENTSMELFQSGWNPFAPGHDTQLKHVFQRWRLLVEQRLWRVGPEGVKGGIEKWREADTKARWRKYRLPPRW